ncbi:MAG: hypothetical protein SGPRY_009373 [Prymnesium sp.]
MEGGREVRLQRVALVLRKPCGEARVGVQLESEGGPTRVKRLAPNGLAEEGGLREGDLLLSVNSTRVHSFVHGAELISAASGDVHLSLLRRLPANPPTSLPGSQPRHLTQALAHLPTLGESPPLPGESSAKPLLRPPLKQEARMRLFALYGLGSFAISLGAWWTHAPEWLEVRPIELPGHGWRESEPLPLSSPPPSSISSDVTSKKEYEAEVASVAARRKAICAQRDELVAQLCDAIAPFVNMPYALYGFSNGAMLAFLIGIELERRGLPLPCHLFCAGRGAPHIHRWGAEGLLDVLTMTDEQTISWAEAAGILAPAAERGGMRISKRFAPVARSGVVGMFGVGEWHEGCDQVDGQTVETYLLTPPQLKSIPLTVMLSNADSIWPSERYLERWSEP